MKRLVRYWEQRSCFRTRNKWQGAHRVNSSPKLDRLVVSGKCLTARFVDTSETG